MREGFWRKLAASSFTEQEMGASVCWRRAVRVIRELAGS